MSSKVDASDIVMRQGRASDAEAIVSVFREYGKKTLKVTKIRSNLRNYPSVVACCGGNLVGFLYCLRFAPDILEIANIYISKEYRNRGVGNQLLEELMRDMPQDFRALIAVNSSLNKSVERKKRPTNFYLRSGFIVIFENSNTAVYLKEI